LAYGSESQGGVSTEALDRFSLSPRGYYLCVARLEPENNTDLIVREHLASGVQRPLVVVGGARYRSAWHDRLFALACDRVKFVGGVYEPALLNGLYANCRAYLHGHEVGGTNPGLLRAMAHGAPVLAVDCEFNREVAADGGRWFGKEPGACAALLRQCDGDDALLAELGNNAKARAAVAYRWDDVADGYAELFRNVVQKRPAR
jgi:glycosyltransferase involved in cell wall biosynthesis